MQDKLGSLEEILLQGTGYRTVLSLCRKKSQIPQRTRIETSGHRAGQIETTNTEGNQESKLQAFEWSWVVLSAVSRFLFSPKTTEERKAS